MVQLIFAGKTVYEGDVESRPEFQKWIKESVNEIEVFGDEDQIFKPKFVIGQMVINGEEVLWDTAIIGGPEEPPKPNYGLEYSIAPFEDDEDESVRTPDCGGLFFKSYDSIFFQDGRYEQRRGLRLKKRESCKGCPQCKYMLELLKEDAGNCTFLADNFDANRHKEYQLHLISEYEVEFRETK